FPSMFGEKGPERLVVPSQDPLPRLVAQNFDEVRRTLDVGEHEGLLDAPGRLLATELPREELLYVLHHDRRGRAGEGGFAQLLLGDRFGADHVGFQEIPRVPVERGRGDRYTRARADTPLPVDACPYDPLIAHSPRS